MTRFIVLTFAFLAWGFYELSGGADYAPEVAMQPIFAPAQTDVMARAPAPTRSDEIVASTTGSRSTPVISSPRPAVSSAAGGQNPAVLVQAALTGTSTPVVSTEASQTTTSAIIARAAAASQTQTDQNSSFVEVTFTPMRTPTAQQAEMERAIASDIREVTGNRVNMRSGPSTSYAVVETLPRGTAVEVVDDLGSWLKLRTVESGRVGYMAERLVAAKIN